jgi:uncharacterized membrane protein
MDLAILNENGALFLLRWFHVFFGVIWIGLLYYFNFVQGAFFAETDANTKSNAIQKLLPRALWWFRWGAMGTFITGWLYLMARGHLGGFAMFASSWGAIILTGSVMGSIMWANVWFVIWPNQKIVIESATLVAQGKTALTTAAAAGARALVASRTNTCFSIALIFFMTGASHLPLMTDENSNYLLFAGLTTLLLGAIEANALFGKTGPLTTIKGVIHAGFGLTVILYALLEICL